MFQKWEETVLFTHQNQLITCINVGVNKSVGVKHESFLVAAPLLESQQCQVRAQHISASFKTLPGWVNSCRLELEINYSASTSSLSL